MSIEQTLLQIRFDASKPEIEEIEKDIEFAIEGRHTAEAVLALVRTIAVLVADARPEVHDEMLRRIGLALAERVKQARQ